MQSLSRQARDLVGRTRTAITFVTAPNLATALLIEEDYSRLLLAISNAHTLSCVVLPGPSADVSNGFFLAQGDTLIVNHRDWGPLCGAEWSVWGQGPGNGIVTVVALIAVDDAAPPSST